MAFGRKTRELLLGPSAFGTDGQHHRFTALDQYVCKGAHFTCGR